MTPRLLSEHPADPVGSRKIMRRLRKIMQYLVIMHTHYSLLTRAVMRAFVAYLIACYVKLDLYTVNEIGTLVCVVIGHFKKC